ncbi:response regulator transcription factor [Polynucleobacter sp. 31A-FELB]|uniref:response regulator transcription factor n=1 Tax=Polynucleobacter sp. 31A-FELB TaxID=2689096 RepID=UPI001C20EE55|nr:response regulator [Polynucleobacter sp. 31A-FELB]
METNDVVYVVDDDLAILDSLKWLLESNGYIVICHHSAENFLKFLENTDQSTPSCALIDVKMKGMSGLDLQEKLIDNGFNFPVSFITGYADIPMVSKAFRHGAIDFIQKPINEYALFELINRMLTKSYGMKKELMEITRIKEKLETLTRREKDVVRHIISGKLNKEIAEVMGIEVKTVEAHRANLMDKLQVNRPTTLLLLLLRLEQAKVTAIE